MPTKRSLLAWGNAQSRGHQQHMHGARRRITKMVQRRLCGADKRWHTLSVSSIRFIQEMLVTQVAAQKEVGFYGTLPTKFLFPVECRHLCGRFPRTEAQKL